MLNYPPFNVRVTTPRLELVGASDERLEELEEVVRAGRATSDPAPYDDPMSLYEQAPDVRVQKWLQGIWRGRASVSADFWRLNFAVLVDGRAVGVQDLIGDRFGTFGTVVSFSWLDRDLRGRGIGAEMRHAILHLAFDGLGASEAATEAFVDNQGSNGVSRSLGYRKNGVTWATRRGHPGLLQRWRITQAEWIQQRRSDIELAGLGECKGMLGID